MVAVVSPATTGVDELSSPVVVPVGTMPERGLRDLLRELPAGARRIWPAWAMLVTCAVLSLVMLAWLGLVIRRYGLSPDGAMAYLRRVSQDSNRKLYDIAAELVATPSTSDVGPPAATGGTATGDSADAQHARELLRQVHHQVQPAGE